MQKALLISPVKSKKSSIGGAVKLCSINCGYFHLIFFLLSNLQSGKSKAIIANLLSHFTVSRDFKSLPSHFA